MNILSMFSLEHTPKSMRQYIYDEFILNEMEYISDSANGLGGLGMKRSEGVGGGVGEGRGSPCWVSQAEGMEGDDLYLRYPHTE
jgi:hypothetical protein